MKQPVFILAPAAVLTNAYGNGNLSETGLGLDNSGWLCRRRSLRQR